jgi:hypothetical protein
MRAKTAEASNDEASILARVIQAEQDDLSPEVASAFLKFKFPVQDRDRMHELLVKNQDGALNEAEQQELANFRRVGRLLDLLAARARRSLAKHGRSA